MLSLSSPQVVLQGWENPWLRMVDSLNECRNTHSKTGLIYSLEKKEFPSYINFVPDTGHLFYLNYTVFGLNFGKTAEELLFFILVIKNKI